MIYFVKYSKKYLKIIKLLKNNFQDSIDVT